MVVALEEQLLEFAAPLSWVLVQNPELDMLEPAAGCDAVQEFGALLHLDVQKVH